MKIQVYEDGAHFWRWRAVAENGRVVADGSEGYDSPSNVERAVSRVAEMFQGAAYQVERIESSEKGSE